MSTSEVSTVSDLFFVDDPLYHDASSRQAILESLPGAPSGSDEVHGLLTPAQERSMFLQMNCLKWMAAERRKRATDTRNQRTARIMLDSALEVRNRIVSANLGLVRSVANRLSKDSETRDELFGEGSLALIRIVEHFNVGFGFKFSTYAMRALSRELGRILSRRLRAPQRSATTDGIEELPMPEQSNQFDNEQQELALEILEQLPDRERELLKVRYGFYGNDGRLSFRKLSRQFGVSAERLRQLERKSCEYAREHYAEKLGMAN